MRTHTEATLDDLYRVAEHGKAELVNGELVLMSPTGGVPGRAGGDIYASLRDAEQELRQKLADYFAAGTLVVWDVDVLRERVVQVYHADNPDLPTIYHSGDRAEAEPALPGWSMSVDDLLP